MKKIIVSIALALFILNVNAEGKKEKSEKEIAVPELVKKAFEAKYPEAAKVEWESEKPGEYEAEFKMNKAKYSATYDEKGNLLEEESRVKLADLPQAIKDAISKDFAGYEIEEVEKTDARGTVSYEMEAKKELKLEFDSNGKLLKQEAGEDEEKEGHEGKGKD